MVPEIPLAQYLCECGAECQVNREHCWIWVTCTNPDCKEYQLKQLATYKKHQIILPEVKI